MCTFFVASHYAHGLQVCQPASKAGEAEVCAPYKVEDLAPGLLLLIVLAWPYIKSVEVVGIGKLERQIEQKTSEIQLEQQGVKAEQRELALQVSHLSNNVVTSSRSEVNVTLGTDLATQNGDILRRLELLESRPADGGEGQPVRPPAKVPATETFEDLWRKLEPFERVGHGLATDQSYASAALRFQARGDRAGLTDGDVSALRTVLQDQSVNVDLVAVADWYRSFKPQLEAIRIARSGRYDASNNVGQAAELADLALEGLRRRGKTS